MSEAEAREAVRGFREMQAWAEQNIRDFSADPEVYARRLPEGLMPAFGIALAWDTLVILSLLGDVELARRADEYRRSLEGDEAEGERRWRDRQERLRPWVIEQLRKLGR